MWVYKRAKNEPLFTVGFYSPNGEWHTDSDWENKDEAAKRVSYLNGGTDTEEDFKRRIRNPYFLKLNKTVTIGVRNDSYDVFWSMAITHGTTPEFEMSRTLNQYAREAIEDDNKDEQQRLHSTIAHNGE